MEDTLVSFGSEIKSLGTTADGKGRIGGYLVRWGSPDETDLTGDFFTAKTYLGAHDGNGADAMIHHGQPLKFKGRVVDELKWTRDVLLPPLKTHRDDIGLFAETVCDMSDEWERKVYELAAKGKFKWSSGAAAHTVRRRDGQKSGEILRWPIVEGSLTPSPCEVRNTQVMSLKAYLEVEPAESDDLKAITTSDTLPYPEQRSTTVAYPTREPVLTASTHRCGACGVACDKDATKCPKCGAKVTPMDEAKALLSEEKLRELAKDAPRCADCNTILVKGDCLKCHPEKVSDEAQGETKAKYLGEWVENDMTMAALNRLNEALMYRVVSGALSPSVYPIDTLGFNKETTATPAERVAIVRGAFDEFQRIALDLIERAISSKDADAAAKSIHDLYNPETKGEALPDWRKYESGLPPDYNQTKTHTFTSPDEVVSATHELLRTSMPMPWQAEAVREAADGLTARIENLSSLKAGRVISAENHSELSAACAALKAAYERLSALVEMHAPDKDDDDTAKSLSESEIQNMIARYAETMARINGVPV